MKNLTKKILSAALLSNLTATTILPNYNIINSNNHINKTDNLNIINHNENSKRSTTDLVLEVFFGYLSETFLENDLSINFQNYYRLKTKEFRPLTYKDIAEEFKQYLHKKYDLNFNIKADEDKKEEYLIDGLNESKIRISLFKTDKKWFELVGILKINLNDSATKLALLREKLINNHYEFTKDIKFNDANELVSYLNDTFLNKREIWSDIKVELNEDFWTISPLYSLPKQRRNNSIANFVCLNLKLNDCSIPVLLYNLQTNLEIENPNEFEILNNFNIFILTSMINDSACFEHYKNYCEDQNRSVNHQGFTKDLNTGINYMKPYTELFFKYVHEEEDESVFFKMKAPEDTSTHKEYVKLNSVKLPPDTFIKGRNILKLLIAKNEACQDYVEYDMQINYWDIETKPLPYYLYKIIKERHIFEKLNYPNNTMIENSNFRKGEPQINTYNVLLEKIKETIKENHFIDPDSINFKFKNPDVLLKNGHNIINTLVKFYNFQFPIDFQINVTNV